MMAEVEESAIASTVPPWYTKIFEYVKNRNKICPGKVEFPDCDFFIVGPRRTLRVLIPTPKGSPYYEPSANERPETIDENFVSRWGMRPHPSGNCRCSFRQSNRLSNEERIISAEINRIRTSLCEAEKSGENIEQLERRISINLDCLSVTDSNVITRDVRSNVDEKLAEIANVGPPAGNKNDDDLAIKKKIVKDLEEYIEVLLQEVLNDTMKFFIDSGDTLKRSREALKNEKDCQSCDSVCLNPEHLTSCKPLSREVSTNIDGISEISPISRDGEKEQSSFDIKFVFHGEDEPMEKAVDGFSVENDVGGYVNRGFAGTAHDPDSLNFDLRKPINTEINLDNLDCVDSGINSVETIEFQTSQEPSLEQSLMAIINEKFGRGPLKSSWEDLSKGKVMESIDKDTNLCKPEICEDTEDKNVSHCNNKEEIDLMENNKKLIKIDMKESIESLNENAKIPVPAKSSLELDDMDDQPTFDKLRLELIDTPNSTKKTTVVSSIREKLTWSLGSCSKNRENKKEEKTKDANTNENIVQDPVELRIKCGRALQNVSETIGGSVNENGVNLVKFRKYRKPMIVFLHGFGSSAEIFEHQLEYFSKLGYPCIAPEMLGHGMSSAPDRSRDYHFDKLLKDLETVLQHYAFRPGRKCVLVAHNYGCSFATALACKYDSNIHQLVLISGGGPTPLAPPSIEGAGHCCLRAMLTPLLMCGLHRDILYSARGRQHPYCGPEQPEQWPYHMKYVLDGMVWPEGDYVFHRRICTPTLLIHGLRDNKVSLVQECQMERTIIKAFLDAIPTAGHTPMTDCPEQVNHMIHCFIDLWKRKNR